MTDTAAPAPVQFVPLTARAFLATVNGADGKPLAIAGARGRFSKPAAEALAKAHADGFVFIGEPGHPDTEVKAVKAPKPAAEKKVSLVKTPAPAGEKVVTVPTQTAPKTDAGVVRAWAKANGVTVGERGRIHPDVVAAYAAANGGTTPVKPVSAGPVAKAPAPKAEKVRKQTVAYGPIRRGDQPKHISEPILALPNCYGCKAGVAYCKCAEGVRMPKWAGGEIAVFTMSEAKSLAK